MDDDFTDELVSLLNTHNLDTRTNIPDFILADALVKHLENIEDTNNRAAVWRGDKTEVPIDRQT